MRRRSIPTLRTLRGLHHPHAVPPDQALQRLLRGNLARSPALRALVLRRFRSRPRAASPSRGGAGADASARALIEEGRTLDKLGKRAEARRPATSARCGSRDVIGLRRLDAAPLDRQHVRGGRRLSRGRGLRRSGRRHRRAGRRPQRAGSCAQRPRRGALARRGAGAGAADLPGRAAARYERQPTPACTWTSRRISDRSRRSAATSARRCATTRTR